MPKNDADSKSVQMNRLARFFRQHPKGAFTVVELADHLGCDGRTVRRYVAELTVTGRLALDKEKNRWRLVAGDDRPTPLDDLSLDLREGAALYIAARLLLQQTDERNDHVTSALERLIAAMPSPLKERLIAPAARATSDAVARRDIGAVFSAIVEGWAHQRLVEIRYRPPRASHAFVGTIAPYLLEPVAAGRTVYVIGLLSPPGHLRTLKMERIEAARLGKETFVIPDDFDGAALLDKAWGIMYGEQEPVTVVLRFSKWVRDRVHETVWHPTQHIADLPDGGCEWTARIGDTTEISPWVRGWGRDCEVLEPPSLRDEVIHHIRRLSDLYGLAPDGGASAKTDPTAISPDEQALLDSLYS